MTPKHKKIKMTQNDKLCYDTDATVKVSYSSTSQMLALPSFPQLSMTTTEYNQGYQHTASSFILEFTVTEQLYLVVTG